MEGIEKKMILHCCVVDKSTLCTCGSYIRTRFYKFWRIKYIGMHNFKQSRGYFQNIFTWFFLNMLRKQFLNLFNDMIGDFILYIYIIVIIYSVLSKITFKYRRQKSFKFFVKLRCSFFYRTNASWHARVYTYSDGFLKDSQILYKSLYI